MNKTPRTIILLPLLAMLFLFASCASTRAAKNASAMGMLLNDSEFITELPAKFKKSHLRIIPTEETLVTERIVWLALYYDDKRVTADITWESSNRAVVDLRRSRIAPGLECMAFCRSPQKVTISATIQSVTVKRSFIVQPANRKDGLQIMISENADFSLGSEVDFAITYNGEDVTAVADSYNTKNTTSEYPIDTFRLKGRDFMFCSFPGETYLYAVYKDDLVFRMLTITPEHLPLSILIPQSAVLKPGNTIQLSAYYDGKDVTEESEWEIFYVVNDTKKTITTFTQKKGECICEAIGTACAIVRYQGYNAFVKMEIKE